MAAILQRTTFEMSRCAEYFNAHDLERMTGQPAAGFAAVALKELVDNGLDAAETAGVAPTIGIGCHFRGRRLRLVVRDNGRGLPAEVVRRILNFNTRTSDKAVYRSVTRGQLGNATKTILGMPCALGGQAPVIIEAHGIRHIIKARISPAGDVSLDHVTRDIPARPGTRVAVSLPWEQLSGFEPRHWALGFALFNPHASVQILNSGQAGKRANASEPKTRKLYRATVPFSGPWRKFLPGDLTSLWWYDGPALARLVFAHIRDARNGGRDLPLREFVQQFKGLTRSGAAKAVCACLPAINRLTDFEEREDEIDNLLAAMRHVADRPPSPNVLGKVGEDHLRECFEQWYGVRRWWYRKVADLIDGVPFVFEVAVAYTKRRGAFFHGINFSPTFDDPLAETCLRGKDFTSYGIGGFLESGHAHPDVAVHLISPALEFLDHGKTRLNVPALMAESIAPALGRVTRTLYVEGERRRKDAARQARADRAWARQADGRELTLKQAVARVVLDAVREASGELNLVSAHTLFYHVRPMIQRFTSRELSSDYFEQSLLPAYQKEHGPIPGLYYEPRGILYEPHTGREIPLGTREVESYDFPTWLYDKILFVEKKGLWPVLKAAKLAERYDLAIVAGEGYATEACRVLFSNAERGHDYQLFVLHDADPHGYNIARTLREETRRMPGHNVDVIDLGLKLDEALEMGLPTEVFTRKKALPRGLELNAMEREYFEGTQAGPRSWLCRRVELNAFSNPALVSFSEQKLESTGVRGKVIPPVETLTSESEKLFREVLSETIDDVLDQTLSMDSLRENVADAVREALSLNQAPQWIQQAFAEDRSQSWRGAIRRRVHQQLDEQAQLIEKAVLAEIHEALD